MPAGPCNNASQNQSQALYQPSNPGISVVVPAPATVAEDVTAELDQLRELAGRARRHRARFVPQHHEMDCAAACLETVVQCYGRRAGLARCREVVRDGREGASLRDIQLGAEALGFECLGLSLDFETDLASVPLPVVIGMDHHFVVLHAIRGRQASVLDPAVGPLTIPIDQLNERTAGICLAMVPRAEFHDWPEVRPDSRRYVALLRRHWRVLLAALGCSFALMALGAVGPWLSRILFDEVMPLQDGALLGWVAAGYLAVSFFSNAAQFGRQWLLDEVSYRIDRHLNAQLYDRFFALPLAEFQRQTPGDVTGALDEVSAVRDFLTGQVMQTLLECGNLIVYLALLWAVAPPLVVVALVVAPLYSLIPVFVGPVVRRVRAVQLQRAARLDTMLLEQIAGIRTIKALGAEDDARAAYVGRLDSFLLAIRDGQRQTLPVRSATDAFESVVSIGTLLFGAWCVVAGKLSVGEMVAGTLLVAEFLRPVAALAEKGVELQEARLSLDRVEDAFKQAPEDQGGDYEGPIEGDIAFEDVCYRFSPTAAPVVDGLNLVLRQGEITAIVGRSGSGKTTIAHLIQRLLTPETGRVTIGGRDIRQIQRRHLRQTTGLALSEHPLFQGTILDNVAYGSVAQGSGDTPDTERALAACGAAQIADFVGKLPRGIHSRIPESGLGLSSGQKQRLALARLFYRDASILVLDEVTSYLDTASEAAVLQELSARRAGRTIAFITHRPSILKIADRVVVLRDGRITSDVALSRGSDRKTVEAKALTLFETL
ncbi:MAG: subfamily B ATP-binding cassette protein HlyB/CyaB [Myxococcota bacterium]|jgi:subfamily B ATP-binding cassette protein HlyB/CyaB